jgi:hypothetical protein
MLIGRSARSIEISSLPTRSESELPMPMTTTASRASWIYFRLFSIFHFDISMLSLCGDLHWGWPLGKPSPERLHSVTFRLEGCCLFAASRMSFRRGGDPRSSPPDRSNNLQGWIGHRTTFIRFAEILIFAALCSLHATWCASIKSSTTSAYHLPSYSLMTAPLRHLLAPNVLAMGK